MDKHTPGPWKYGTSNAGWTFDIYQADDAGYTPESSDVATLYIRTVECDPKAVQEANARLIAAAPDLLELLEEMSVAGGYVAEWHARIHAAIAKADGPLP